MYPHKSLKDATNIDELVSRLTKLREDNPRQWGKMNVNQMLCHLSDAFLAVLGIRPAKPLDNFFTRTVVKYLAIHTRMPWPHGVATTPEVNQMIGGTKPVEFERDRERVLELLRRFVMPGTTYARHPGFGAMTRDEWMLWGYGHVDHHLRQFSA